MNENDQNRRAPQPPAGYQFFDPNDPASYVQPTAQQEHANTHQEDPDAPKDATEQKQTGAKSFIRTHKRSLIIGACITAAFALFIGVAAWILVDHFSKDATQDSTTQQTTQESLTEAVDVSQLDLEYSGRDSDASFDETSATTIELNDGATVNGSSASSVSSNGQTITISGEGTYVLSGTLTQGQVIVEAEDTAKVQLVLKGVSIHNESGPAIRINAADKVFVTLAEGTTNTLTDGSSYTLDEGSDEPNATLFSKADLTINGSGALNVTGSYAHAINSKDDLVIAGGTFNITSQTDAVRGRDCVKISDGTFNVTAGEDAFKSNNDEDATRGFVLIDGGTYSVSAGDDAFHAETALLIRGGDITVTSCEEGYEAALIQVEGGNSNITANDDGLNASYGSSASSTGGGTMGAGADPGANGSVNSGAGANANADTGAGTDANAGVTTNASTNTSSNATSVSTNAGTGTTMNNAPSSEGTAPSSNGTAPSGDMANNGGAGGGGGMGEADSHCQVKISGGTLSVNAGGDGIDSNGTLEITGGTVLVSGPENNGNSALDYASTATVSGGTMIIAGMDGMAQGFSSGTQAFAMVSATGSAGSTIQIVSADGTVLASFTAPKQFDNVVVSAPGMTDNQTYQLLVDGTATQFTASTTATQSGMGGGQGAMGDDPGSMGRSPDAAGNAPESTGSAPGSMGTPSDATGSSFGESTSESISL
ncbi:MAG: carbohydrate-binding domain-containing protein [Eggerthellaceae bacterium]